MKTIKLNLGYEAIVDDEDYELLSPFKWFAQELKGVVYARRISMKRGQRTYHYMHRVVMGVSDKTKICDHVDHNGLNNQKANLRVCSKSQNCAHRRKKVGAQSKYMGVIKCKKSWQARMTYQQKPVYLGAYSTEEEAAMAYNVAAQKYHGEFATLNIIS